MKPTTDACPRCGARAKLVACLTHCNRCGWTAESKINAPHPMGFAGLERWGEVSSASSFGGGNRKLPTRREED